MKMVLRKERGPLAVEWLDCGERQDVDMGGEALLSCRLFVQGEDVGFGAVATQVRRSEDPEVLDVLLDRLLDRLEACDIRDSNALLRLEEQLRWFGPEMAEEY